MHWVLQNNLFNEDAYGVLLETLVRFGIPHSIHKVIPFIVGRRIQRHFQ